MKHQRKKALSQIHKGLPADMEKQATFFYPWQSLPTASENRAAIASGMRPVRASENSLPGELPASYSDDAPSMPPTHSLLPVMSHARHSKDRHKSRVLPLPLCRADGSLASRTRHCVGARHPNTLHRHPAILIDCILRTWCVDVPMRTRPSRRDVGH